MYNKIKGVTLNSTQNNKMNTKKTQINIHIWNKVNVQSKRNKVNIVNNFISPSHDRSLTIAIYYKNTKLRQLFIKN